MEPRDDDMTKLPSRSARSIAAEVLHRFRPTRDYAGTLLEPLLDRTTERQRATDLVYGTVRNLHAIDVVIELLSGRPPSRIAKPLLSVLRVAVYELAYNPAVPDYSIVNEAVKNAGRAGGAKQRGFVNAVLRQILRHIVNRQTDLAEADPRRTLRQTPQEGCEFDLDILPDPVADLPAHLSTCFSLPAWLVNEWLDALGADRVRRVCLACNRRPSLYIRVNRLGTTAEGLLKEFASADIPAELVPGEPSGPDMIRVTGPHAVTQLPGFEAGRFVVQDLSAARVVAAMDPQPGWSILDLCSAPGTKTTQLAEITQDAARVLATDIDHKRLERVQENIVRLVLESVAIVPYDELAQDRGRRFDAILLDVPCSNSGVLARRIEARFRITSKAVAGLARTQAGLLEKATALLQPGGRIAYSTCSIQRQENGDVVRRFLADHPAFELLHEDLLLPEPEGFDHDGGYIAILHHRRA